MLEIYDHFINCYAIPHRLQIQERRDLQENEGHHVSPAGM